jgi:diacylglycerol kinase
MRSRRAPPDSLISCPLIAGSYVPRSWTAKFASAFRGLWLAAASERSFAVHLPVAAAVVIAAIVLRVSWLEAGLLCLCIAFVIAAETFNTAIELLAREITRDQRPGIAAALDMASGAVLTVSVGSAIVGGIVFISRAGELAGWWK